MDQEPTLTQGIFLSDSVIREEGTGKLSLIGTFQTFNALKFPFASPPFIVTVSLSNLRGKLEQLRISVRIEEAASGHVAASNTAVIGSKVDVTQNDIFEIPIPILPAAFPTAGLYHVVVLVNNENIGRRNLMVRSVTAGPTTENT